MSLVIDDTPFLLLLLQMRVLLARFQSASANTGVGWNFSCSLVSDDLYPTPTVGAWTPTTGLIWRISRVTSGRRSRGTLWLPALGDEARLGLIRLVDPWFYPIIMAGTALLRD
jgi:hypothetical protein